MKGEIVKKISSPKLTTFIIKLDDGRIAKTNIVPWFGNAVHWIDLEPEDKITGLKFLEGSTKIIDGDSDVERI